MNTADNSGAKCPVCFSERTSVRHKLSAAEAAQHFVSAQANPDRNRRLSSHIAELWGASECFVRECGECNFGFADPFRSGDAAFYNLAYERAAYPSERWEFTRTIRELSSIKFRASRVLEVGAGFGHFLDKIVDRHVPRSGVEAIEFSADAIKELRRKGYTVFDQDVRSAALSGTFDAIFLFQVVEHMDKLDDLFSCLARLLTNEGLLFIAVPNPERTSFNETNGSLIDMPPNHVGRWSPRAFQLIAERNGMKLMRHEVEPFSLREFIKQDIQYSYLRRAQQRGTVANWSRSLRSKSYGKLMGLAVAIAGATMRIGVWRKASRRGDLGGSLWTALRKSQVPQTSDKLS